MAIRILPENLANQIAAGEVVERPASVVKELLENAVDAGARNLTVQVEGRAVSLIRVSDDGGGMSPDDLLLCLERHATSKIVDAAGLSAIRTLGFRGEALPSIASVSRLTLTSRPAGAELGSRVEVHFGTVRRVLEAGAALGTTVEVRDLFANVPARRKFLKSARTELYHLEECVKNCGLAFPALGILYQVEGRTVLQWPAGVDDPAGRVRRLLKETASRELLVVGGPQDPVSGLLLAPEDVPATGSRLRVFVNGRPVRDRMIGHAVGEALHNQLLRGRQPAGVLFIRVDPATVDVNVHPTKQEIRFQQPREVHGAVLEAVRRALGEHEQARGHRLFGAPAPRGEAPGGDAAEFGGRSEVGALASTPDPAWPRSGADHGGQSEESGHGVSQVMVGGTPLPASARESARSPQAGVPRDRVPRSFAAEPLPFGVGRPGAERPGAGGSENGSLFTGASGQDGASPQPVAPGPVLTLGESGATLEPDNSPAEPLRLLGQVLRSYIVCASPDGLLVVDQHAAHERLLYQRLLAQYDEQGLSRQTLMFPAVLECTPAEAAALAEHRQEILRLGLEIEDFGGNSRVVKAVPALLAGRPPAEIVAGVLARYLEGEEGRQRGETRLESVLAGMACKAAVKAGQALAEPEMAGLLKEMQAAGIFSRCPHGRPVVRRFGPGEIDKWFNR